MTISDFLTTCAGRLRAAVSNRRAPLRGKGAENPGITARIAAAGLFALAAIAAIPAPDAQAQAVATRTFTFTDTTDGSVLQDAAVAVPQGGSASFNVQIDYSGFHNQRWLGANVIMRDAEDNMITVSGENVINDNTSFQVDVGDFIVSIDESVNASNCETTIIPDTSGHHSCIFLLTKNTSNGGTGTFKVMIPIRPLFGGDNNDVTIRLNVMAKSDAATGATTFVSGSAPRFGPPASDGSITYRGSANFDIFAAATPSTVTYTVVDASATLTRTSNEVFPAVAGASRTFSVALANIPATETAADDVQRVGLVLQLTGGDLNAASNPSVFGLGIGTDACVANTPCGWETDDYRLTVDVGAGEVGGTPAPRLTTSADGQLFLHVPYGNLTDGGRDVDFTLTINSGRTPALGQLGVEVTRLALLDSSGSSLRDIFGDNDNADHTSTTFNVVTPNARLDFFETVTSIGDAQVINVVEGDGTTATGTVSISDSATAVVNAATLSPTGSVTAITATRVGVGADPGYTAALDATDNSADRELTGLVPGIYEVVIATQTAGAATTRTYTITLTVTGISMVSDSAAPALTEDGVTDMFTISLAGIDTSDSVTGALVTLQFPAGSGDFTEASGVWSNSFFNLTFPSGIVDPGEIGGSNAAPTPSSFRTGGSDRIRFVADFATGTGTVDVPITIGARLGSRGNQPISISGSVRLVNASNAEQRDGPTPRPNSLTYAVAVTAATPPSMVSIGTPSGITPTLNETGGILEITVSLDEPATDQITLPITLAGNATPLTSGNGITDRDDADDTAIPVTTPFAPSDGDYALISAECDATPDSGLNYCNVTGDDLVFELGQQTKTLTLRARADGHTDGDDNAEPDETVEIMLDASGINGLTASPASVTVTLENPDFEYTDPMGQRLVIGGPAGSITLQITDFEFPDDGDTTDNDDGDLLGVTVDLGQIRTPGGDVPSQAFPRANSDARSMDVDQGQEIRGNILKVSLTPPATVTGNNRPFIISRSGNGFTLMVPKALFALGAGKGTAAGQENITLNVSALDGASAQTGDFTWRLNRASSVYTAVSAGQVNRGARVGNAFGSFEPNAAAPPVNFSVVRASAANPLPRTMNPETQDVLKTNSDDIDDGGVITVALPGITAPPNAVEGEIVLDVTSDTVSTVILSQSGTDEGLIVFETAGSNRSFALRVPGVRDNRHARLDIPGDDNDDISLSFVATERQPIRGSVTFRVIPADRVEVLNGDNVTFTASGVIFRNSAGNVIDADGEEDPDFEVALTDTNAPGNVAKVNAISAAPTSILSGLKVGDGIVTNAAAVPASDGIFRGVTLRGSGEPNLLSESSTPSAGAGLVEIPFVDTATEVAVEMRFENAVSGATGTTVTGTGGLTADPATTSTDSPRTVMVSGFTPGMNTFTIAVAGADPTLRTYTISVIVPPEPPGTDDSTLRSVTVDGGLVETEDFGADPATVGAITGAISVPGDLLPLVRTVEIVATPRNADADVTVCTVTDANGSGEEVGDPAMASVVADRDSDTTHEFRILVFAVADADSPPLDCGDTTRTVADDDEVDEYFLTVTVEAVPNDATIDIAATTLDPDGAPVEVPVGDITYSLTAGAGTATADIVLPAGTAAGDLTITATGNGARVTSIGAEDPLSPAADDNTASRPITGIANEGTLTFTVRAENGVTEIDYTITYIVQDALLTSATFATESTSDFTRTSDSSVDCSATAAPALFPCTGRITGITAGTTSGTLLLVLADTDDTIYGDVTGVTEAGGELGISANADGNDTTNDYAVSGLLPSGTSTLTVVVRPEDGDTDGDDDRTYKIALLVENSSTATPAAGIRPVGRAVVAPGEEARFNVFLTGFNTIGRSGGTVRNVRMRLRFDPPAGQPDAALVRSGRTFTNAYYSVTLPDTTVTGFFNVGGAVVNEISFWVGNQTGDTSFTDDGIIYLPIDITPLDYNDDNDPATPEVFASMATIRFVGAVQGLAAGEALDESVLNAAIDPRSLTYTITDGPLVSFTRADDDGTATEAAGATRDATFDLTIGDSGDAQTISPVGNATVTFTLTSTSTPAAIAPASASDARADYTIAVTGRGNAARTITYGATNTVTLAAADRGSSGEDEGEFLATFTVTPRDDRIDDDNENVTLTITSVDFSGGNAESDAHLASIMISADLTITDDDSPPAGALSVADPAFFLASATETFDLTMTGIPNEILNTVPTPDALVDLDYLDVSLAFTAGGTGVDTSFTTVTNGATSVATDDFSLIASGAGVTFRPRASGEGFILRVPAELFDNNEGTPMTPGAETITFTVTSMDIDDVNLPRSALFTPDAVAWGTDDPAETPEAGPTFTANTVANFIIVAATSVCRRTAAVRDAIVAEVAGADCDAGTVASEPTTTQLGAITSLTVDGLTTSLLTADFAGLGAILTTLNFTNGTFTDIPAGFFTNLTGLTTLSFGNNTSLGITAGRLDDVLDSLTTLTIDSSYMATPSFAMDSVGPLTGTASLTVELDQVLPVAVRIPFTAVGTAVANDTTGVIIPAGAMRNTVAVPILGSNSDMDTVDLTLGTPVLVTVLNGVATDLNMVANVVRSLIATNSNAATITLRAGPVVSLVSTDTATEANRTAGNLLMTLTRVDTTVNEAADITFTIGTGGATRGADYALTITDSNGNAITSSAVAGGADNDFTFQLAADAMDATFVVTPVDDSNSEDDETVTITITAVNFPNLTTQPMMVTLPAAGVVTITDNDADAEISAPAASSITENGPTSTTFTVDISSAASSLATITITLSLTGSTANYGGANGDYTIASADLGSFSEPGDDTPAGTGTVSGTITPAADGTASATFIVMANDDSVLSEGNETIRVTLSVEGTDNFALASPTTRSITIEDNDEPDEDFCDRTGAVGTIILAAVTSRGACENGDFVDSGGNEVDPPTAAELSDIEMLNLAALDVTELKEDDLESLTGLETLMLPRVLASIEPGALDAVLGSLGENGLVNFPPGLKDAVSVVAAPVPGEDNIQQGRAMEIRVTRSNPDETEPFAAADITYTLTPTGMAEDGDFTVTSRSATASTSGTSGFAANGATVGTLGGIAVNGTITRTLSFAANEAEQIVTIVAARGTDVPGGARFEITDAVIPLATQRTVSDEIIERTAGALIRDLQVTLPVATPTLSGDISIGEKSEGEGVVTLDLGTGGNESYGDGTDIADVTFTLSNPEGNQMPTSGDPIPRLVDDTPDPDADDYSLVITDSSGTPLDPQPTINRTMDGDTTLTLDLGVTGVGFAFTAINDDRREGNEVVTLTITEVDFKSAEADPPFARPLSANVTITEISGDDIMRETQMIAHAVGKEQVNLITGLVRQRVSALTLGTPEGFSEPGVQLALAENPETMEDFFSQMALESSGEMDEGGAYAIWAKGQYIKISGSPDVTGMSNFEYDGKIAGIGMGMEKRFSESLVGLSMNFSTADIDSSSDVRTNANYKETMTFFAPYAAWKPNNSRLTLWGTAGAGFGSATVNADEHAEGNPSVQAFFAQGGVDISDNLGETAEFVFGMSAVAIEKTVDAWTAGTDSAPEAESSIFQAQADATAYFPVYSDDGQVLRPYVGLASVHDIGDVTNDDRHAMEVQTGIAWSNGPWQVSFDTFYQFLRDDEEAWGVFGEAQWSGTGDLDGLLMGVTSGHGTASSMSDAASSTDSVNSDIDTNLADADTETAEWSIQTTSEYGFAAPMVDRNGRATPFFRSTHSADARSFVSGVRMDVTDNIGVTAESNRHIPADDDPYSEHAVGLEARWEF